MHPRIQRARAGQSVEWSPRRCSGRKRTRLALSGRLYESARWSRQLPRAILEDQPPRSSSVASTPNESLLAVRTCGEVDERRADTVHDADFEWLFEACSADRLFLGKSRKFGDKLGLRRHRERSLQLGYGPAHQWISIGGAKQCYGAVVVTVSCTSYKSSPFGKKKKKFTGDATRLTLFSLVRL